MEYRAKDYSHLYGMNGFSKELLQLHFALYQGYVKNTNLLLKKIEEVKDARSLEYGALKRRLGWEFDGMRLHEFYFDNLGGKGDMDSNLSIYKEIEKNFGSYEEWKKDFINTGMIRGIGWAILYRDPQSKALLNVWINEHDLGHLAGGKPILIMDVFEHAYMPQYGLDREKYIDAFFQNIDWKTVDKRLQESPAKRKEKNEYSKAD
ncbi:MAG: Fe-Mn family superoxide dismutase [Chlamydiae bacterium]|nr:Fe-Mn family superoxide dismutase [Chlamydiota bacterium]